MSQDSEQRKDSNSKKKLGANQSFFNETKQHLHRWKQELRCVKCGRLPFMLHTTGRCEHKYCGKCINRVKNKMCLICDVQLNDKDIRCDKFFSEVLELFQEFQARLGELEEE